MTFVCILLLLFCSAAGRAETIYFPQVADGGGYITNFELVNIGPFPANGTLRFFNQDGTPRVIQIGSSTGSAFPVTIPGAGSLRLASSNSTTTTVSGWASFETNNDPCPLGCTDPLTTTIRGVATFDFRTNGILNATAGVIGTMLSSRLLIPVDVADTANTGLAILNPQTIPISVRLRLFNESGADIADILSTKLSPLGAHQQVSAFLTDLFGNIGPTFKGSVIAEVTGDGVMAATGLTVKEGLLSALPAVDAPVMDTGLPSLPLFGMIPWDTSLGAGAYVYLVGVDFPQPVTSKTALNWNQSQGVDIQVSPDPTFATFPAKKSLIGRFAGPPAQAIFSTNYAGTYYVRARVVNLVGPGQWTATISRTIP
jgi:hypothetical protein